MKYYFKSDYFTYLHPTNIPRGVSEFTKEDLELAKKNTEKFHINEELFETAVYESDGKIKRDQLGTIILFPEVPDSDICLMEEFIKETFAKAESELGEEYNESDDPTIFWESGSNGKHFSGNGINYKTRETFGIKSPSLYIAGCKDDTANYLVETAIDKMYIDSEKYDRKALKNGKETVNFGRFKSFLIYQIGSKRFYEFATHDSNVWHKPDRTCIGKRDFVAYDVFLPSNLS